jgi:hypothetical protein
LLIVKMLCLSRFKKFDSSSNLLSGWSGEETAYLEMVELGSPAAPVSALAACPSTGNLLVAAAGQLTIFRYILAGGNTSAPRQAKFIDFEVSN